MDKQEFHHETMRKKLWSDAFCATAMANNCIHTDSCVKYADRALEEFDKRFPKPKPEATS